MSAGSRESLAEPRWRPVLLVTGGAGGMGLAIARRFVSSAEAIVLADRDGARLERARAELAGPGVQLLTLELDLGEVSSCERCVREAVDFGGRLDVVVNAAGVWVEGPSERMTEEDWDRTLAVNLKATFFLCRYAIEHLVATRGVILNIASDAGLVGNPGAAIYCASKGGVVLLTRALARELAPRGVRVNALCPADVDSPMLRGQAERHGGGEPEAYLAGLLACYPQAAAARFITVEEVAEAAWFYCSPAAAPFTGAAIAMDFGLTAGYGPGQGR